MKRNRNGKRRSKQALQVYTFDQANRVLPYVCSIMKSLREHQLTAQSHAVRAKHLAGSPAARERKNLIENQEALKAAQVSWNGFQETLADLHALDIYCLDAIQGLALIPFVHDNQLAWFVFDLFDADPMQTWRYHEDPIEMRRPIAAATEPPESSYAV